MWGVQRCLDTTNCRPRAEAGAYPRLVIAALFRIYLYVLDAGRKTYKLTGAFMFCAYFLRPTCVRLPCMEDGESFCTSSLRNVATCALSDSCSRIRLGGLLAMQAFRHKTRKEVRAATGYFLAVS